MTNKDVIGNSQIKEDLYLNGDYIILPLSFFAGLQNYKKC